jgi:osmoprotectant transport system substrate-binding protein
MLHICSFANYYFIGFFKVERRSMFMRLKKYFQLLFVAVLTCTFLPAAEGCVGKVLHIGIVATPEELLLAELISQLVTERTGTSVKITQYRESKQIYDAVRKGDVGLFIENPATAMALLGRAKETNRKGELDLLRKEYRKTYNLVWLDSVPGAAFYTPVLSNDLLSQLPALPKLINKLPAALGEDGLQKLVKSVRGDDKSRKVARDFLKSKKLI